MRPMPELEIHELPVAELVPYANNANRWYSDRKQTTVLEFDRPTANREHPTMKPIPLLAYLISNSTKAGDVVLLAQQLGRPYEFCCSIGDEFVGDAPYTRVVEIAREFIEKRGGFEKIAEWGLV